MELYHLYVLASEVNPATHCTAMLEVVTETWPGLGAPSTLLFRGRAAKVTL